MGTERPAPTSTTRPHGRVAGLLEDPPLRDRVTWREGIRPQTLVSRDRGLIARTFGTLFSVGSLIGFAIVAIGDEIQGTEFDLVAMSAAALLIGVVCFVGYRRLPPWFFGGVLVLGSLMITAAAAGASEGAEPIYGFFYVWVVFLAFLFFSRTAAVAQVALAAVGYAIVLYSRDTPYASNLLIVAASTVGTTGALTGLLMARIEAIATTSSAEALTDPLTAIANRRDFDRRFDGALTRARRSGRPLSLIICDLDHFKAVNDALGHEEGDIALRRAANVISSAVRSMDAVCRLGGEEFAAIVPDADGDEALEIAERMRGAIAEEFSGYPVSLSASCGVACTIQTEPVNESLYRAADFALYTAKRNGRDRSVAYAGEELADGRRALVAADADTAPG